MKHSNIFQQQMYESSDFNNHSVNSDENTQYKVNVLGFHQLPRSKSKQWSEMYDSLTIAYQSNNPQKQPEMFKCFKCYGIIKNNQTQSVRFCRQCLGTSFVSDSHRLVSIFEQIISLEFPNLSNKNQNTNKRIPIQTIEKQYACPQTIKEESFSMQEDQSPLCRTCIRQCEKNYYKCDKCTNYYICPYCYSKNLIYHAHRLYPKEQFIKIGDLNPRYNFKAISEQVKFSQVSNKELDTSFKCKNCYSIIQSFYLSCITCLGKCIDFVLCDSCYVNKSYIHYQNHQFTWEKYYQKVDLNSYKESQVDFKNLPWLQRQDSFSDKMKELGLQKKSSVNIQDQTPNNRSVVIIKADISQKSFFQNEVQQLGQLPQLKNKLSKSYQSYKEQQQDFSIRFSQNRHEEDLYNQLQFQQIHEEPCIEYASVSYQRPKKYNYLSKNSQRKNKVKNDRSNSEEFIFIDYQCDFCGVSPIVNRKYHCNSCQNFDLCEKCYISDSSKHQHTNFCMQDGSELKKQRQFLVKSLQQKSLQTSNSLFQISKRMAQSSEIRKNVG